MQELEDIKECPKKPKAYIAGIYYSILYLKRIYAKMTRFLPEQ